MKSIGQKIQQLDGLRGTSDITAWEESFIESILEKTGNGHHTMGLTEKQIDTVERIYGKHFA